jgi:cbb3-type cytochrome oxidase subunit 3
MAGTSGCRVPVEQAASVATIASPTSHWSPLFMGLILLEALGAGIVFILIIWWTMFSGRKRGELREETDADDDAAASKEPSRRD